MKKNVFVKSAKIKIGDKLIGDGEPCFIIAEIGCNHDGKLEQAKKMIDMAVEAKCDAAKFQSFSANKLFNEHYDGYKEGWIEMLKSLEVSKEWHKILSDYCKGKKIIFMSSICDEEKVDWLDDVDVPVFKVPSYELTHLPLLKYAAKKKKPFILSTGIAVEKEIQETLDFLKEQGIDEVAIMHCVSAYPGNIDDLNLKTIPFYKEKFGIPVGLSDHHTWIYSGVVAVALGANLVERHITLDKKLPGPDHHFAMDPKELKEWVQEIRNTEKAMGKIKREPAKGEKQETKWRRSLWAKEDIAKGTTLSEKNIMIVRPSPKGSLVPKEIYNVTGKKAFENIKKGENICLDDNGNIVVNKNKVVMGVIEDD
ncbi:MAG: N-acetylneuraminate synthase family protein [Nanoarchaeota archaeon]|nr:N-acetylneuraminate synthase family protein [Nanoarchaeota archaeon]MBU1321071.1 N-acetylneuraminate synthase family protein [Nanoarchaeota archaeon]MBU1597076.1 N-acetylneuraminate synthase family protein [Nanoarchaeota archaeon]MBU2440866.1 N-acetylneuraminate synthase family protein [Nanoarchaeota archaeon]